MLNCDEICQVPLCVTHCVKTIAAFSFFLKQLKNIQIQHSSYFSFLKILGFC